MSDSGTLHIETLEIEQEKLSRNSNGHKFSVACPIQAHNISRRSKFNNGSYWAIQMVITFHSDVRFRPIKYRDTFNWTTEALENFEWSKLFTRMSDLGTLHIETLEIEQRSSREIQVVLTFHTNVRFGCIICRDAQNWIREALEKFKSP